MVCWDEDQVHNFYFIGLGVVYAVALINIVLCTISVKKIKKRVNQVGAGGQWLVSALPLATASNLMTIKTQKDPEAPKDPKAPKDPEAPKDLKAPKDNKGPKATEASVQLSVEMEKTAVTRS